MLKPVTRYECSFCKGLFKTPDKHKCKMDPKLRNCYGCKHCDGFGYDHDGLEYSFWPFCKLNEWSDADGFSDYLLGLHYNLQCEKFESRFPDPEQEAQIPGQMDISMMEDENEN